MADLDQPLITTLAALAGPTLRDAPTAEKLSRVVQLASATIGSGAAAAVTLLGSDGVEAEASTNALAEELDHVQYQASDGPCLEAVRQLQIFNVGSIARSPGWPQFRAAAARLGIRSTLSVPLAERGRALGMLNLYSIRDNAFDGCEETAARFAVTAAGLFSWGARHEGRPSPPY